MKLSYSSLLVPKPFLLPSLALALFAIQLGLSLADPAFTQLLGDILCKQYYSVPADKLLPGAQCDVEPVRRELGVLLEGIFISTTVAGILVGLPTCVASDRCGRSPVLAMALLGICVAQLYAMFVVWQWETVPVRALWGVGGFLLVGGGRCVVEGMVFAIVSDLSSVGNRTTGFQITSSSVLAAQVLAPLVTTHLLPLSPWPTLFLSLGLVFFPGLFFVALTPESLSPRSRATFLGTTPSDARRLALQTFVSLFGRPARWLLPGSSLVIPLATVQTEMLARLMHLLFDWPTPRAELLFPLRSLASLVTLLLVLPLLSFLWTRFFARPVRRVHAVDSALATTSATLLLLGSLAHLLTAHPAPLLTGLVLTALSSGLPLLCRSMLVTCVGAERIGTLFGGLAVVEQLAFLGLEVGLARRLFRASLESWVGWPFCVCAGVAVVVGTATWLVSGSWRRGEREREGREGQEL